MTEPQIVDQPLSDVQERENRQIFEERADHIALEDFKVNTVLTSGSDEWVRALTQPGAKLLVGPRGCGKTHLMRYAYLLCSTDKDLPFPIYTNFNRYYRLEPLLHRKAEAISLFYTWVLANTLIGIFDSVKDLKNKQDSDNGLLLLGCRREDVEGLVGALERGGSLSQEQSEIASSLTIDGIKRLVDSVADGLNRKRSVIFMDDAALTLAPEFMSHFFDIFRALKSARIAPKASVYPGTTEYGASFHVAHEAQPIFVWKNVTDGNYQSFMQEIAQKRFTEELGSVSSEVRELLAYAAFGVPRTYMSLLRSYLRTASESPGSTPQKWFNVVIEDFCSEKMREYRSLERKSPALGTIIAAGAECFLSIVSNVADAGRVLVDGATRQIHIGIQVEAAGSTYVDRMYGLLEEAGLLYRAGRVSHGDRDYERYIPHLGALVNERAFSRSGGFSPKLAVDVLRRPDEKHPVRRSIQTLLSSETLSGLKLDLPNCENCGARRAEGAKYCYQCGSILTDVSSYEKCMSTPLTDIPGLTLWQRQKINENDTIPKTVGEFLALQDRGTLLRKVRHIGKRRAESMIDAVDSFVEEFLAG